MRIGAVIVAGFAALAAAAATPQQIADGLASITQKFQTLQAPAQSITILNAPLIVIGQGPFPQIIAGFQDIVSTSTALAAQLGGTGARRRSVEPRDADADLVFTYRSLVRVAQATLNILIGKAGVVSKAPVVGGPVATALRGVEAIQDDIAIKLINMFSVRANDLTAEANSLDATMTLAIHSYESIMV